MNVERIARELLDIARMAYQDVVAIGPLLYHTGTELNTKPYVRRAIRKGEDRKSRLYIEFKSGLELMVYTKKEKVLPGDSVVFRIVNQETGEELKVKFKMAKRVWVDRFAQELDKFLRKTYDYKGDSGKGAEIFKQLKEGDEVRYMSRGGHEQTAYLTKKMDSGSWMVLNGRMVDFVTPDNVIAIERSW